MRLILSAFVFAAGLAHADLNQRTNLEDIIRDRVQKAAQLFDPHAQVFVQIHYKEFKGALPGSAFDVNAGIPANPDIDDIQNVVISIYSTKAPFPAEADQTVTMSLPFPRSLTKIEYKKWEFEPIKDTALTPDVLSKVTDHILSSFRLILLSLGLLIGLGFAVTAILRSRDTRRQTADLVAASQQLTQTRSQEPAGERAPSEEKSAATKSAVDLANSPIQENSYIANLTISGLIELFGDCYWCQADGYAHFLWRSLPVAQRAQLLEKIPFIKDYVPYFFNIRPENWALHEHPYYLSPQTLWSTSQTDLKNQVASKPNLWTAISPLRQQTLELNLTQKLEAVQNQRPTAVQFNNVKSPLREFPKAADFGDLSAEDELSLFENPSRVPENLRANVKTLVWLALKDEDFIRETLASLNARALAQAWIGPQEVLQKLESCLPEKKSALLKEYLEKSPPSRKSSTFQQLTRLGAMGAPSTQDDRSAA